MQVYCSNKFLLHGVPSTTLLSKVANQDNPLARQTKLQARRSATIQLGL